MTGRRPRSTDRMVPGTRRFQLRSPPPKKFPHRVITTGVPYVSANARLMRSAQDLLTSYGCRPARRASSVHAGGAAPYALSEDATTTWRTVGERRQASSVTHVPRTLVSSVDTGFLLATPTMVWAARWKTVSISYSPTTRSLTALC